ncbi:hypothetical protein PO909_007931 [Leuciscus waleckii]
MLALSWLLPPSAPPETLGLASPLGSLILPAPPLVSRHSTSATDLRAVHCTASFHLYGSSEFLLTPAPPQPLGYSGYSSDACCSGIALVSSASGVARLHRLFLCACGSIALVSVGRPPVVVSLHIILAPPSTPPWAVGTGKLWVSASGLSPPLPPGDHHHPSVTIPSPHPVTIPAPCPPIIILPSQHPRPPPKKTSSPPSARSSFVV